MRNAIRVLLADTGVGYFNFFDSGFIAARALTYAFLGLVDWK